MRCYASTAPPANYDLRLKFGENVLTGISSFHATFGAPTSLEEDVLNIAAAVYAVDLAVRRNEREGFLRDIKLTVEVVNAACLLPVRADVEELLYTLSNDN